MWDLRSSNSHFVYFIVLPSCITSIECDCSRARTCVCVCAMSVCLLEMSSCVLILCELLCTRLTIHWTNVMCLHLCVCVCVCFIVLHGVLYCVRLLACLIIEWIQNEFEMLRTDHLRWVLDCCTWHSDTQLAYNCVYVEIWKFPSTKQILIDPFRVFSTQNYVREFLNWPTFVMLFSPLLDSDNYCIFWSAKRLWNGVRSLVIWCWRHFSRISDTKHLQSKWTTNSCLINQIDG